MVRRQDVSDLPEEIRMLRDSAAAIAGADALPRLRAQRDKPPGFDRAVWQRMAELGWLGLRLPEEQGGAGLSLGALAALAEELGRGLVPEPLVPAAVLAGGVLAGTEDEALRADLVGKLVEGSFLPLLAWQEAAQALDPAAVETRADGSRLSGVKRFVPLAGGADAFLVTARGGDGLGVHLVEAAAAGVSVTVESTVDGGFMGTVVLDGAIASARLVASNRTPALIERCLADATLATCAELLGVMDRAFEMTIDYLKTRQQFGQPIGGFQALQHRAADLYIQVELTRASLGNAVALFDAGRTGPALAAAVSAAKARASDAGLRVTREAIQLHGAIGYTDEADVGLYLKRAMVLAQTLGNAAAHRRRYAGRAGQETEA